MRFMVVVSTKGTRFGTYVPDLQDGITEEKTREETFGLVTQAIELNLDAMHNSGVEVPRQIRTVECVELSPLHPSRRISIPVEQALEVGG